MKKFIEEINDYKPDVVGLSGFLTLAFDSMKETIAAFERAGMRERFKIMIGGGQIDETVRNYTGADAFGVNAVEAVSLCKQLDGGGGMSDRLRAGAPYGPATPSRAPEAGRLRCALAAHPGLRRAANSRTACRWRCTPPSGWRSTVASAVSS